MYLVNPLSDSDLSYIWSTILLVKRVVWVLDTEAQSHLQEWTFGTKFKVSVKVQSGMPASHLRVLRFQRLAKWVPWFTDCLLLSRGDPLGRFCVNVISFPAQQVRMPSLELAYGISVLVLPAEGVSWDCNIGMQEPKTGKVWIEDRGYAREL